MFSNFEWLSIPWLIDATVLALKAMFLVAVAMVAVRLAPRLSSSTRFLILFHALAATLLLPLFATALPAWKVFPNWLSKPVVQRAMIESQGAKGGLARDATAGQSNSALPVAPRQATESDVTATPPVASFIAALWILGIGLIAARTARATRYLSKLQRQAVPTKGAGWQTLLADGTRALQLRVQPELLFHPDPIMPIALGMRNPAILLPVEAQEWPLSRRRDVLLHELAHLKRRDLACEWIALAACALQWFNPMTWKARRQMIIERERACDDLVLAAGAEPSGYAHSLLRTAAEFQSLPSPASGMARASELETRLLAVLDKERRRGGVSRKLETGIVVAALSVVLPLASLALADAPGVAAAIESVPMAQRSDVDRLYRGVTSAANEERMRARRELEDLGPAHPVTASIDEKLFADYNSDSRLFEEHSAANGEALGEEGLAHLLPMLNAASAVDRAAAARALGNIHDPRAVSALVNALNDSNWHVREWSARSLGRIADPVAVAPLVTTLTDSFADVREWAARSLGDIGDPAGVDGLVQAFADTNPSVREWAARSLGRIGSAKAVDGLIALLQDSNDDVREWALRSLGSIGDPRAIGAIEGLLQDRNSVIREWSGRSLAAIRKADGSAR